MTARRISSAAYQWRSTHRLNPAMDSSDRRSLRRVASGPDGSTSRQRWNTSQYLDDRTISNSQILIWAPISGIYKIISRTIIVWVLWHNFLSGSVFCDRNCFSKVGIKYIYLIYTQRSQYSIIQGNLKCGIINEKKKQLVSGFTCSGRVSGSICLCIKIYIHNLVSIICFMYTILIT